MSKRFTDTGKWKDTWYQDLPTKYKLFWIYMLDECDAAGFWKPNMRLAIFQIGEPFEDSEIKRVFADRIQVTQDGYFFINKFIEFQYGELSPASKPHLSVLKLLEKHKIKGYGKGIDTLKYKYKDKEKEKEKEDGGVGEDLTPVLWESIKLNFSNAWQWKEKFCNDKEIGMGDLEKKMDEFIADIELKEEYKNLKDIKSHFVNWFNKNGKSTHQQSLGSAGNKLGTSAARIEALKKW